MSRIKKPIPAFVTDFQTSSKGLWRPLVSGVADYEGHWDVRAQHIKSKGFSIVTSEQAESLLFLLNGRKAVDLGCGTGYLAKTLGIVGVDNYSTQYNPDGDSLTPLTYNKNVLRVDVESHDISVYDDVIMSWPDYQSPFASNVAKRMSKGQRLYYCGEGSHGCTGDELFHEMLHSDFEPSESKTEMLQNDHVQFYGIHDEWFVYEKK
jgi:hypothetical protein